MIRLTLATLTLCLLGSCGADGDPVPPTRAETPVPATAG